MAFTFAGQYTEALLATGSSGATLLPALTVHVYTVGTTTHPTLYTSRTKGTTTANPVSTDVNGNVTFFVDPGQYDIVFTPPGGSQKRVTVTVPTDPAEGNATYVAQGTQVISVKDSAYGAKGDGTTDDTTAILAAFAAGKNVFFPPGTYRTSLLTVDGSVAVRTISGVPGQSILKCVDVNPTGNSTVFSVNSLTDVSIDGLVFDGNSATLTNYVNTTVVYNSSRVQFSRCTWQNTRGLGLLLSTNIVECSVRDSRFFNVGFAGGVAGANRHEGIAFSEASVGNSYRNVVANNTFQNIGLDCISISRQVDTVVSGNRTNVHGGAGVYGDTAKRCTIVGNVFRTGSGVASPGAAGIDFASSESCTISANVVYECSTNGITFTGKNNTVVGNTCINNNQDGGAALRGGIYAIGSGGGHAIVGNACTDTQGVKTQQYGIIIDTATPSSMQVAHNATAGNGTAGYAQVNFSGDQSSTVNVDNALTAAATLTLSPWHEVVFVSGNTGITSITAAAAGRRVTLVFSGTPTVTDGSNLKLAGNFVATADDALTLVCDGTNWIEVARSGN